MQRPVIHVGFDGFPHSEILLLDTGADYSMAPMKLASDLRVDVDRGVKMELRGISTKRECAVEATIADVDLHVLPRGWAFRVPVAFVDGEAPLLAGRAGFLEELDIHLEGRKRASVIRPSKSAAPPAR